MDKILRIDMGAEGGPKVTTAPLGEYAGLGGRAFTSAVVSKEVPPLCHPLGGNNKLVIAPGLLSGTAAGLLQTFILPSSQTPMIGASGAVAGVLGAYLVLFPRSRVASLVPIFFIFTIVEIPAFIYLLFWFLSQLYSGWLSIQGGTGSGIAWWAHIGGFVFGLFMSFVFANRQPRYRSY